MDQATRIGHIERARRWLRPAIRLVRRHPVLAERLARRALAAGDPSLALDLADACRMPSDTLRALQRVCLAELDRPAPSPTPEVAGLRLAARQVRAGVECAAARTLRQVLRDGEDPLALMLLLSLCGSREDGSGSGRLARRIVEATHLGDLEATGRVMLDSTRCDTPPHADRPASPSTIDTLARELTDCESAIAPIAAALGRSGDHASVELLVAAVRRALPRLVAPAAAAESIADLRLACRDPESARRWAERALGLNPFSAIASRLLHQSNHALYALTPRRLEPGERHAA